MLKEVIATRRAVISEDELLIELSECYLHTQSYEDAALCLRKVQETAVLRQDSQMIIRAYLNIGLVEFHLKRYHMAIYNWQKALDEMEKLEHQDDYLKGHILTDLGQAHEQLGMMKEAIIFYSQASSLYSTANSMEEIAKVYMGLGQSYKRINDHEKAADYSQRAISIFEALENVNMRVKVQVSVRRFIRSRRT